MLTRPILGEEIRALRERLRLSQQQFAKAYAIDLKSIQNWEQDKRIPRGASAVYIRLIEAHPRLLRSLVAELSRG